MQTWVHQPIQHSFTGMLNNIHFGYSICVEVYNANKQTEAVNLEHPMFI